MLNTHAALAHLNIVHKSKMIWTIGTDEGKIMWSPRGDRAESCRGATAEHQ